MIFYNFFIVNKKYYETLKEYGDVDLGCSPAISKKFLEIYRDEKLSEEELKEMKEIILEWMKEEGYSNEKYAIMYEIWGDKDGEDR